MNEETVTRTEIDIGDALLHMFNEEDSLEHHGVLGMKWGVRRYQNYDGSLTPRGEARLKRIEKSGYRSRIETATADRLLNKNKRSLAKAYNTSNKRADKYAQKSDKLKQKGKEDKANKYLDKSKDYSDLSSKLSKEYSSQSKLLEDIRNGKIKAGKDFMVQTDYNTHGYIPTPYNFVIGLNTTERNLITRDGKRIPQYNTFDNEIANPKFAKSKRFDKNKNQDGLSYSPTVVEFGKYKTKKVQEKDPEIESLKKRIVKEDFAGNTMGAYEAGQEYLKRTGKPFNARKDTKFSERNNWRKEVVKESNADVYKQFDDKKQYASKFLSSAKNKDYTGAAKDMASLYKVERKGWYDPNDRSDYYDKKGMSQPDKTVVSKINKALKTVPKTDATKLTKSIASSVRTGGGNTVVMYDDKKNKVTAVGNDKTPAFRKRVIASAKSMKNAGMTLSDIADRLGVAPSTVSGYLNA